MIRRLRHHLPFPFYPSPSPLGMPQRDGEGWENRDGDGFSFADGESHSSLLLTLLTIII
jgi:hypothetical protein